MWDHKCTVWFTAAVLLLCLLTAGTDAQGRVSQRKLLRTSTQPAWQYDEVGAANPEATQDYGDYSTPLLAADDTTPVGDDFAASFDPEAVAIRVKVIDSAGRVVANDAQQLGSASRVAGDAQSFTARNKLKSLTPNKASKLQAAGQKLGKGALKPTVAADALAAAADGGAVVDAAGALVTAATTPGASARRAVGDTLAALAHKGPRQLSKLLAAASLMAATQGALDAYSAAAADSLRAADAAGVLPALAASVADSITESGTTGSLVWGTAIASAVAGNPDTQQALARATAEVMCDGGARASAWASAVSVSLSQNADGCLVLNEAIATAVATCADGVVSTTADSQAVSTILGFCGLPQVIDPVSWTQSDSGSDAEGGADGGGANAGAAGSATTQQGGGAGNAAVQAQVVQNGGTADASHGSTFTVPVDGASG